MTDKIVQTDSFFDFDSNHDHLMTRLQINLTLTIKHRTVYLTFIRRKFEEMINDASCQSTVT